MKIFFEFLMHMWVVQVKFKLCHMTQVLLKLRATVKESQAIKVVFFSPTKVQVYYKLVYILPRGH